MPRRRNPISGAGTIVGLLNPSRLNLLATSAVALAAGMLEGALLASLAQVAASLASDKTTFSVLGFSAGIETYLVIAAVLAAVRLALGLLLAYLPARLVSRAQRDFRVRFVAGLFSADLRTAEAHGGGAAVELIGAHCNQACSALMSVTAMIASGGNAIALAAFALFVSPAGSLILAGAVVGLFAVFRPLARRTKSYARKASRQSLSLADSVLELSDLALEVNTHGVGREAIEHIQPTIDQLERDYFKKDLLLNLVPELYQGVILFGLVATLALARGTGGLGLGQLGAIVLLLLRTLQYTRQFQANYQNASQFAAYGERLRQELQVLEENKLEVGGSERMTHPEKLEVSDVSFQYSAGGEQVLQRVSLQLERGKAIGLVGRTGSGKSTLLKILAGALPPTEGAVLCDGRPIAEYAQVDRHRAIAVVPQGSRIFTADVRTNVRFLRSSIDEQRVDDALEQALLIGDPALPSSFFQEPLGRRGITPSGGQAQRISLARALAGDPTILLLDEPSSALDERTENRLRERLLALKPSMAILLVTHRPALLSVCDDVFTLRDSKISPARDDLLVDTE